MPGLVLNPLQARLYDILSSDAALGALVGGIYDNPPDDVDMPYVLIGDDSMGEFTGHTFDGFDGTVTFHVWAEGQQRKICKDIMDRLYRILQNKDLFIPDFKTVCFYCILSETLVEPEDNRTYHGIQRYRLIVTGS